MYIISFSWERINPLDVRLKNMNVCGYWPIRVAKRYAFWPMGGRGKVGECLQARLQRFSKYKTVYPLRQRERAIPSTTETYRSKIAAGENSGGEGDLRSRKVIKS